MFIHVNVHVDQQAAPALFRQGQLVGREVISASTVHTAKYAVCRERAIYHQGDDEHQGAEVPNVVRDRRRRARCVPDRAVIQVP